MKKIISVLLLCTLLFSFTMVQAAEAPSLDFLLHDISDKAYSDVQQSGTINVKLNEPLLIFDVIEEYDLYSAYDEIDLKAFVERFFDSVITFSAKTKVTENGKKISTESHIKSDIPFKVNENLEGDFNANQSAWMDVDLSDEENPRFDMIQYGYNSTKYITASSELFEENGDDSYSDFVQLYTAAINASSSDEINEKIIESMSRNATITGNSSKVKIHFDDAGLKMCILELLEILISEVDESAAEDMDEAKMAMAMVKIFDDDALILEYNLDRKGRISKSKIELNINVNIYDIFTMFEVEEIGLTKENSNINFTVTAQTDIKYDTVTIKKPVLTEENSIDIFEYEYPYYYDDEYYDDYEYDENWIYEDIYVDIDKNCIENNEIKYVCLRNLMDELGYSIYYEDGKIFGETENPYTIYKALLFTVGGDTVSTDIHDVALEIPIFVVDGVSYISVSDLKRLTGYIDVEYSSYDFFSGTGYIEFVTAEYYNIYFGE